MKMLIHSIVLFMLTAVIYFAVATQFTFHPKWVLDYFNLFALSLREGHIDLINPSTTYDLISYENKWYAPWGMLAALFFIPLQFIKGGFFPPVYLSVFFASLNVLVFYWLIRRVYREFFPSLGVYNCIVVVLFYAFGTMNFYVGTLGSSWHVDQIVTSFFGVFSLYIIFKHKRVFKDYLWSIVSLVPVFLGHATLTLLSIIPLILYIRDIISLKSGSQRMAMMIRGVVIFIVPLGIGSLGFFLYNYLRFGNIFEYGYQYILEAPELAKLRIEHGIMSLWHLPNNIWYFAFNPPSFYWNKSPEIGIDLYGNSLFILSPPLLSLFLVFFRRRMNVYVLSLLVGAVITFMPSLLLYSTGWMQFGYRYGLDIMPHLVLLTVFGMRGRISSLYSLGVGLAIMFHIMGIQSLM